MTSTQSVKLVHGAAVLDLGLAPYELAEGFTPPATLVQPIIAAGTSANRFGGGTPVGRSAHDRAFSFGVHLGPGVGSASLVESAARRIQQMLDFAGDPDTPLYLVYRSTPDTTQPPLWGQSALYYEINFGTLNFSGVYGISDMRARTVPNCTIDLQIKPYAQGTAQLLANATGGILPDQWGTPDGLERGLQVPEATTNKMTNPVFGSATWNTGWTMSAGIASQNTNPSFLLPQTQNSALLQGDASAPTFYQTINVGSTSNHTISALVMRPDGAAVTASDCQLYYNVNKVTTYQNLGDGLWLLSVTMAGINAGTPTGLNIKAGMSMYLLAMQIELGSYNTTICWGDLLGCAWTGTAHASTSTRTVAACKLAVDDTILRANQGSVAITVIPNVSSATAARDCYLFSFGAANMRALWQNSTGAWFFIGPGNANSVTTGALAFTAGTPVTIHITWGAAGEIIYVNGVSQGSGGTYSVAALAASMYIGSSSVPGGHWPGDILDFRTYAYTLTAAEVLADYNNTNDLSGATVDVAQRVNAIPWLYTSAGDGVVGSVNGVVSSVQKYNWAVAGGVAGSAPALTELKLTHSVGAATFGAIWLSRLGLPFFYAPTPAKFLYAEMSGTADSGASSGDAFQTQSVNTGLTAFGLVGFSGTPPVPYSYLQGREAYTFIRLKDAGANLTIAFRIDTSGGATQTITTDLLAVAATSTMQLFKTPPFLFPRSVKQYTSATLTNATAYVVAARSIAGAANVSADFFQIMLRPLTQIDFSSTSSTDTVIHVRNRQTNLDNAGILEDAGTVKGDIFELDPGVYNLIVDLLRNVAVTSVVTDTLTYNAVYITPRYSLT